MERENFENEWKRAFEQAEISPSDNLWTSIELDLERTEGGKMKRKLLQYKLLAAASVTFAMCFAGIGVYLNSEKRYSEGELALTSTEKELSTNQTISKNSNEFYQIQKDQSLDQSKSSMSLLHGTGPNNTNGKPENLVTRKNKAGHRGENSIENNNQGTSTAESLINAGHFDTERLISESETASVVFEYRKLPSLIDIPKIEFHGQEEIQEDPFELMMARLDKREAELAEGEEHEPKQSKSKVTERLWTSLGVAAGNFNSSSSNVNASANSNATALAGNANSNAVNNQSKASGNSYSAGLHVGAKVSERWVLHGGVNYMKQTSAYQSDAIVGTPNLDNFRTASLTDINSPKKSDKTTGASYYNVNNSVQYVSVPVQAGYIAINHAVAFQINAGASTDLFIQNTLTPENSNLDKVTQSSGKDSPYRPVNFSALFGTELSYRFGRHYRIALNPGVKYPINSIYKVETGVISKPITMDVAMRFRYIF